MKRVLQIFRSGREHVSSLNEPLLDGEQGNLQTLAAMAGIVRDDRLRPDLRAWVLDNIVGNVPGHDSDGELGAIFQFTRDRITYRQDPWNVERVADMASTLDGLGTRGPEGDCGIKSVFFATAAALLGYKPFFVAIKQKPGKAFNHVYNAVVDDGRLRYFDATPEDEPAGYEPAAFEKWIYTIFD